MKPTEKQHKLDDAEMIFCGYVRLRQNDLNYFMVNGAAYKFVNGVDDDAFWPEVKPVNEDTSDWLLDSAVVGEVALYKNPDGRIYWEY